MKFILKSIEEPFHLNPSPEELQRQPKCRLEFHAETIEDVLSRVDQFLKGSGYLPQGELGYEVVEHHRTDLPDGVDLTEPEV